MNNAIYRSLTVSNVTIKVDRARTVTIGGHCNTPRLLHTVRVTPWKYLRQGTLRHWSVCGYFWMLASVRRVARRRSRLRTERTRDRHGRNCGARAAARERGVADSPRHGCSLGRRAIQHERPLGHDSQRLEVAARSAAALTVLGNPRCRAPLRRPGLADSASAARPRPEQGALSEPLIVVLAERARGAVRRPTALLRTARRTGLHSIAMRLDTGQSLMAGSGVVDAPVSGG